ncbi:MAG: ABC transporter ATP-binding protein [Defluviitaleaceae bacterium]|nr:ABC transporter ATP-binding protein [Defluviitaleaceae bacterium]
MSTIESNNRPAAVEARGLSKIYKTSRAVDDISIHIPAGVCCGFLGKNGAGKTTTLKMLVGLKRPTAGEITIMGEPLIYGAPTQLPFGYLPDVPNYYSYMNGAEFLTLCAKLCGIPANMRKAKVTQLLETVGLSRARSTIAGYSRGMKQRLGIAQALINDPAVVFMDEPISALDPIGRRDVTEIIRTLKQTANTTVILSTHILADVEDVCDYVLIIEHGKIMAQDYLVNLKRKHRRNEAVIRFHEASMAEKFTSIANGGTFTLEATSPVQFTTRLCQSAPDAPQTDEQCDIASAALSRAVNAALHTNDLSIESYTAHSPSLEEIFLAVIKKPAQNETEVRHA